MLYVSRKDNETLAKLVGEEEKYGTVMLEYVSGEKVGKSINITNSTLKRWWKPVEDTESVGVITDPSVESVEEVLTTDTEVVEETPVETPSKRKETRRKKTTSKVDNTQAIEKIKEFLKSTFDVSYYESVNCYKLKTNGKSVAEVYLRRKQVELRIKNTEKIPEGVNYKEGYKYYLPVHVYISYDNCPQVLQDILL